MSMVLQSPNSPRHNRTPSGATTGSRDRDVEKARENRVVNEIRPRKRWFLFGKFTKTVKKFYKKLGMNHFVPLVIVAIYTLIGAAMFQAIEYENNINFVRRRYKNYSENRQEIVMRLFELGFMHSKYNETENYAKIVQTLNYYESANNFSVANDSIWDFWNAMYFAGTVYTTIGYGNIACQTVFGRVMTMFYALFGIPLVLLSLNDLGKWLFRALLKLIDGIDGAESWFRLQHSLRLSKNKAETTPSIHSADSKVDYELLERREKHLLTKRRSENNALDGDPELGLETASILHKTMSAPPGSLEKELEPNNTLASSAPREKMISETESENEDAEEIVAELRSVPKIPVWIALSTTVGWIFLISGIFCIWETNWTYFESIYFFFISLSTIGLGDVVPEHPKYMVMNFVFVIVGLSLVSMSINVIQQKLEELYLQLLLLILDEYQKQLQSDPSNQIHATMGMMHAWNQNPRTKFLMPLLSKDRRNTVVQKFKDDAKEKGVPVPPIFQQVDHDTGFPKILTVQEKKENKPFKPLETIVEETIVKAEAAAELDAAPFKAKSLTPPKASSPKPVFGVEPEEGPVVVEHETTHTQTNTLGCMDEEQQTWMPEYFEQGFQTDSSASNFFDEASQTLLSEMCNSESQTATAEFREDESQTPLIISNDHSSQTPVVTVDEKQLQTHLFDLSETVTQTEIVVTKNERIQTPHPEFTDGDCQTDPLPSVEEPGVQAKKPKSKAWGKARKHFKSALGMKKKAATKERRPINPAMANWADEEEDMVDDEEEQEDEEVEEDKVSLHWDPHDGLHAEKQMKVGDLKAMFEQQKPFDQKQSLKRGDSSKRKDFGATGQKRFSVQHQRRFD